MAHVEFNEQMEMVLTLTCDEARKIVMALEREANALMATAQKKDWHNPETGAMQQPSQWPPLTEVYEDKAFCFREAGDVMQLLFEITEDHNQLVRNYIRQWLAF